MKNFWNDLGTVVSVGFQVVVLVLFFLLLAQFMMMFDGCFSKAVNPRAVQYGR